MTRSVVTLALVSLLAGTGAPTNASQHSATITVTGLITSVPGRAPVAGAQVQLVEGGIGAVTGKDGWYRIVAGDSLRGRTVTLLVRALGYAPQSQRVSLARDSTRVDVPLAASAIALESVVATGAAVPAQDAVHKNSKALASAPSPRRKDDLRQFPFVARERDKAGAFNTEGYAAVHENPFISPRQQPLSTFGIDVDRASYANVRRFLTSGTLPPVDAVRLEELVNYFPYDYPAPNDDRPVSIVANVASAPWAPEHRLVRIALQARKIELDRLPPSNLVFLIDVSGSMSSENKLPLLKRAFHMLVDQLREDDHVALVVYAGNAGLVLPSTPGSNKQRIHSAIDALESGGSTAGGAGIALAYKVARDNFLRGGNNRVILATDGDFNVGASSDAEMERLIVSERNDGTFLTVLGFGMGNYKDSKLETLADKGNGNYAYIDSDLEARKVFVHELGGTLLTVAKDVKLQVEFNPEAVKAFRLLGYENRLLRDEDFNDDRKDAGDMGAGHSVTAFYEIILAGSNEPVRGVDTLRYQQVPPRSAPVSGDELLYVKLRYKERDGNSSRMMQLAVPNRPVELTGDFRFAAAVAEFALLLRDSEFKRGADADRVIASASASLGRDPFGYRAEFVQLARTFRTLDVAR
ncbi:MAG: von Willebrand factor type A domain-containing protein, partial [Gemmatimonadaceae bacterium]